MIPTVSLLTRLAALLLVAASPASHILTAQAEARPLVVVNKDPNCGCCSAWAKHLERAGFPVNIVETSALQTVRRRLGVPHELVSCHTAEMQGYVLEGHVPVAAILRLLAEKPRATGLAVPGMPIGSPGMEGGKPETYEVVLFVSEARQSYGRFLGHEPV